jgi:hypothetical protein
MSLPDAFNALALAWMVSVGDGLMSETLDANFM